MKAVFITRYLVRRNILKPDDLPTLPATIEFVAEFQRNPDRLFLSPIL